MTITLEEVKVLLRLLKEEQLDLEAEARLLEMYRGWKAGQADVKD